MQIAAQTAAPFNPNVQLTPIFGNIKEPQYDIPWFQGFDIVLNALDNLGELTTQLSQNVTHLTIYRGRRPQTREQNVYGWSSAPCRIWHSWISGSSSTIAQGVLNCMFCIFLFSCLPQNRTECFDCIPKPTPKTFPVCTIRSTPSQPIHCIVWSKSYLLGCVAPFTLNSETFTFLSFFLVNYSEKMRTLEGNWMKPNSRAKMVPEFMVYFLHAVLTIIISTGNCRSSKGSPGFPGCAKRPTLAVQGYQQRCSKDGFREGIPFSLGATSTKLSICGRYSMQTSKIF